MKQSFSKLFLAAAACAALTCCNGSGNSSPDASKTKMLSPGHFLMQGRENSVITISDVSYPRMDGTPSISGNMVIRQTMPNPLPQGPVYATHLQTDVLDVELPPAQEGEIPHAVQIPGRFTEKAKVIPVGDNTVGNVQLSMIDQDGHFIEYVCEDFNLVVTGGGAEPQGEPRTDYEDPNSADIRIVQDFRVRWTGVAYGVFKITSDAVDEKSSDGFYSGILNVNGCPFVWECDETRVIKAFQQNNNPQDPIIGL